MSYWQYFLTFHIKRFQVPGTDSFLVAVVPQNFQAHKMRIWMLGCILRLFSRHDSKPPMVVDYGLEPITCEKLIRFLMKNAEIFWYFFRWNLASNVDAWIVRRRRVKSGNLPRDLCHDTYTWISHYFYCIIHKKILYIGFETWQNTQDQYGGHFLGSPGPISHNTVEWDLFRILCQQRLQIHDPTIKIYCQIIIIINPSRNCSTLNW